MNYLRTFLAVLLGFLLGAMLFQPRTVRASGGAVYIKRTDTRLPRTDINGSEVVGFSCPAENLCYIASQ
jgi:hypothetical protein